MSVKKCKANKKLNTFSGPDIFRFIVIALFYKPFLDAKLLSIFLMIKLTFGFSLFCSNVLSKNLKQKYFSIWKMLSSHINHYQLLNEYVSQMLSSHKPLSVTKWIRFSQLFCFLSNAKCQNSNANFLSNETNWIGEINLVFQSPFFRHGNVI